MPNTILDFGFWILKRFLRRWILPKTSRDFGLSTKSQYTSPEFEIRKSQTKWYKSEEELKIPS
ncbi:hypothetical protein H6F74_20235 [Trichocoleus sp. FACHB-90]|uniref:hypothetical protein n=1 Tax=Trichocoleus sp. FACHB-40 TaxID=2692870 RepID=UPI0016849588|nr:hypothetical protein [Trichocoleus sp. FACHB-40]MBD1928560.1 hypothetical protein [Trichocoleus sp. FACHB-90]